MDLPLRHRICARPMRICWVLGTLGLWIPVTVAFYRAGVFPAVWGQMGDLLNLLVAYAGLVGFGFFAGMLTMYWLVVRVCRRVNGAPFAVGDEAAVLTGPKAGMVGRVYELTRGQGDDPLVRLDLGAEARERYGDLFEDFTVWRRPGHGGTKGGDAG